MNVIVDGNGLQARAHAQDGRRLDTFLALLAGLPACRVSVSPEAPLTAELLAGQDVLIITTRKWQTSPYTLTELDSIPAFVRQGGGLLLLSNHGDVPGRHPLDMTRSDALLARAFGIEIENAFFSHPEPSRLSEFGEADLLAGHPILRGAAGEAPVRSLVTNNCCSIVSPDGAPLIRLTDRMIDHRNGFSSQGRCFAIALENNLKVARGRVVMVADSGFIGTAGTTFPGVGLIDQGDNSRFAQNAVRWLGRAL
ncbi:MAG: hypothetical protein FJ011_18920 [Chloroflexi bacterium]|nr:hypothetical protein [Chloroflexota bacterium]